ncbi:MAG: hypothetical protein MI757_13395, partial [Pirellulales bacterium]|nr:hypothetical protein [Pirellulales bacterium]
MDKVRRTIRRVKTSADITFDDQLWPINVVLVVMAAFVAGLLLASERSLMFKSVGIATVVTIIGALIYGVSNYHGHIARRIQLSCALSLLVSLAIVVSTGYYDFKPPEFITGDPERKILPMPEEKRIVVQQYVEQEQTDEPKDFETPVETSKAEQETAATTTEKQDVSHAVAARPKMSATSESKVTDPQKMELRRIDAPQSAARRKPIDTESTKVSTNSPTQVQQVDSPQVAAEAPKTPQRPQPKVSEVARREAAAQAQRQVTKPDPTTVARPAVTAVERRVNTPEKVTTPARPTPQPAVKAVAKATPTDVQPVEAQPTEVVTSTKPVTAPAPAATANVSRQTSQSTTEKASVAPSTPRVDQPRPSPSNISKALAKPTSTPVRAAPSPTERVQLPSRRPSATRVEQVAARAPAQPSPTRPGPQAASAAVAAKSASGRVTPGRKSTQPSPTRHQGPSNQQVAKAAARSASGAPSVTKAARPTERASAPGARAVASSASAARPEMAAPQPTSRPSRPTPSAGNIAQRSAEAPNSAASRRSIQVSAASPTQAVVGGAQRAARSPDAAPPNASHVAQTQPQKSKTSANIAQSRVDFSSTPVTNVTSTASPTVQASQGAVSKQIQADNLVVSKTGAAPLRTLQQQPTSADASVAPTANPTSRPQLSMRSMAAKTRSQVDRADSAPEQIEQPQLDAIAASERAVNATPETGSLEQSTSPNAGTNAEKSRQLDGEVSRLAGAASVEAERAAASNPNVEAPQTDAGRASRASTDLADASDRPQTIDAPEVAAVGSSQPQVAGPAGVEQTKASQVATGDGQPQRAAGDAPAASLTSGPSAQPVERATGDAAQPTVEATAVAAAAREATTGAKVDATEVNAPEAVPLATVANAASQPTVGGTTGAERSESSSSTAGAKATTAETSVAATAANTTTERANPSETAAPAATAVAANDAKAAAPSDAVVENLKADVVAQGNVESTGPTVAINADGKASDSDRSVTAATGTPTRTTQGAAQGTPQATAEITALARETAGTDGPSVEKVEAAIAKASGPSGVRDTATK